MESDTEAAVETECPQGAGFVHRIVRWYVCPLNKYGLPDWKEADGPHDDRRGAETTIGLMNRLSIIEKKERVICEVIIHEGKESTEGLNHDAIGILNSISANAQGEKSPAK